ncbi:MAG: PAS domain-containing sensor histidine kinase [Rhizobiaceae bacterium]|nr:PAS domain-containing sensor histidine kinase [Rhizobiaceae bacterium]
MAKNSNMVIDWLELLADENLRGKALGKEAVIVYAHGLERVIWANVSAAKLFGGSTISEFISVETDSEHPFFRQLSSAVKQLGEEPIYRGFRVVDEGRSRLLQCEIGLIELPINEEDNQKSIIVTCTNGVIADKKENEIATMLLDGFAEYYDARAICDEYGLIISANDEFAQSTALADAMEKACSETGSDLKSQVQVKMEIDDAILHLYLLSNEPRRYLALSNMPNQENNETGLSTDFKEDEEELKDIDDDKAEEPPNDEESSNGFVGGVVAGVAAASSAIFGKRNNNEKSDEAISVQFQDDLGDNSSGASASEEDVTAPGKSDEVDETEVLEEDTVFTPNNNDQVPEQSDEFVLSDQGEPVRFAWTTNTEQVFTSVTPELGKAVGPNSANIVGRKWSDVATVFGFDSNGEINDLLKKRDTWSGKSVLWPVQGTDLHVPVDLAALPSFSSGRNFDGFRGFGIVRMLDTIVDPDETGLSLVDGPLTTEQSEEEAAVDHVMAEDSNATNIVELKIARDSQKEPPAENLDERANGLSNGENRAFHEIGRNLRDFSVDEKFAKRQEAANIIPEDIPDLESENLEQQVDTSLLEKLPVPVLVYRDDVTLFANSELLNLTGYSDLDELRQAGGINALFGGEDSEELVDENETVLSDKEGGQMRVKAHLQSVPWDKQRALLLSFRQPRHEKLPINEKIVLDMMRVSELQNILDTATDGILIVDQDGIIQSINQSAEALFGQADDEVSEKPVSVLFAAESHEAISEYLANMENPSAESLLNDGREVIGVEAKGGLIPLYITIGKIGASDKYCAILRDMTPWKKTQGELIDAKKLAEDASDQKTEFLARVSHEIRTPLNAIIGFSDVMIEERFGPVDNERYREYLRDINRSGVHVLDLINDLLDISKIEAGKMELTFEAVDLNKVVGETVALLQPQANGNRVIIRTSLSRAVPNVVADARSIRQIVLNLVSNAIKFTQANGQVIVSTVYEGNGEVALRVRDTGRGMSEEEIVIALKPFRQVNSVSETHGHGTGLGLPLTKALVEANKAYLDIESEPGEGTIVHIQFPTQRVLAD